jgi:nucleoside-diphosphate-sugar epimerase
VKRVLLIGGAGYVGIPVTERLVRAGMQLTVLDNFTYGKSDLVVHRCQSLGAELRDADFKDLEMLRDACINTDAVVVLAGLVGDPIVRRYPELAVATNDWGMKEAVKVACAHSDHLIFVSTCSNYGLLPEDQIADEDTRLNPVSDYARAKVAVEAELLGRQKSQSAVTLLRFATAFGVAPRMRFDLTVNEFAKDLTLDRNLDVYDPDTWRPYCHVDDLAEVVFRVLDMGRSLDGEVFNVGDNRNNFTKRYIAEVAKKIVGRGSVRFVDKGSDPRNYRVSFEKISKRLDFQASRFVEDGIAEVSAFVERQLGLGTAPSSLDSMGNYVITS